MNVVVVVAAAAAGFATADVFAACFAAAELVSILENPKNSLFPFPP